MQKNTLSLPRVFNGNIEAIDVLIGEYCKHCDIDFTYDMNANQIIINLPTNDVIMYHNEKAFCIFINFFISNKIQSTTLGCKYDNSNSYSKTAKKTVINIGTNTKFTVHFFSIGEAILGSKLKKKISMMQLIRKFDESQLQLHMLNNGLIVNCNGNGYISIYPDTLDSIEDSNILTVDKNMVNITGNLINITNINIANIYNLSEICVDSNISNDSGIFTSIGNILSWVNPLSYFTTSTQSSEKTLTNTNDTNDTNDANDANEVNYIIDIGTKYYFDSTTNNIIKVNKTNKKIKILKPISINIPLFIDNILFDENNGVTMTGFLQPSYKPATISFNKFFLGANFSLH